MAASLALRVLKLLPRSTSRWSRNVPINQRRREVIDVELAGLLAGLLGGIPQQQTERVSVGGDRSWAGVALRH